MNVDLQGFKHNCGHRPMGDFIIHNNRYMSESDTRKLVNYAIEQGYETLADVPDEVADKICVKAVEWLTANGYKLNDN